MAVKQYATANGVDFKYVKGKTDIYGNTFHTRFELYLLLGGSVCLITDRACIRLRPYQLAVIPPEQYHQFIVEGNVEEYERCVLNLDVDFIDAEVLKNALSGKELLTLSCDERIVQYILSLKEEVECRGEEELRYLLPAIATAIVFCIKHTERAVNAAHGGIGKLSREIMNHLNAHYTETIELAHLAELFHFSISTLCHAFKEDFGITIKQYVMQKRLNTAKFLLDRGGKSEEVCRRVGFLNYSAFFKAYKKQFGVMPSNTK